jgi:predicted ester cyclase
VAKQSESGDTFVFARISYFKGTRQQIDAAVDIIRDRIEPSLRTRAGFLGSVTGVDRDSGEGLSSTFWETGAEMGAADQMGVAARSETAERTGVQLTDVDRFEVLLQDRVEPSQVGTYIRTTELQGAPDKIDAAAAFMRDKGIDLLRSRQGYRGMLVMANRASGRIRITSAWSSAAERDSTDALPSNTREEVAQVAGSDGFRVTRYEVVLSSVSQAAQQAAPTGRLTSAEYNATVHRRYVEECWSDGDMDLLDELVAEDVVDHNAFLPGVPPSGLEGRRVTLRTFRAAFDFKTKLDLLLATGDYTIGRWTTHAIQKGEFLGTPATGQQSISTGIDICRYRDRKIVEIWHEQGGSQLSAAGHGL